jgi:hypothetical protein
MLVKGDVKCLHCGYISGEWVGRSGAPLTFAGFKSPRPIAMEPSAAVRCLRCEGPVFLENAGLVSSKERLRRIERLRAQLAAFDTKGPKAA